MGNLFLIFVVSFVVFISVKNIKRRSKPVVKVNGKVVAKSANIYNQLTTTRFGTKPSNYTEYVLTFELDHGDKIELLVDKKIYEIYFVDDYGKISYQDNQLVSFEKV